MNLKDLETKIQIKLNKLDTEGNLSANAVSDYLKSILSDLRSMDKNDEVRAEIVKEGLFLDTTLGKEFVGLIDIFKPTGKLSPEGEYRLKKLANNIWAFAEKGCVNFSNDSYLSLDDKDDSSVGIEYLGDDVSDLNFLSDVKRIFTKDMVTQHMTHLNNHKIYRLAKKYDDGTFKYAIYIFVSEHMPLKIFVNLNGKIYSFIEPAKMANVAKLVLEELSQLFASKGDNVTEIDIIETLRKCELTLIKFNGPANPNNPYNRNSLKNFKEVSEASNDLNSILSSFGGVGSPELKAELGKGNSYYIGDIVTDEGNAKLVIIDSNEIDEIILIDNLGAHIFTLSKISTEDRNSLVNYLTQSYNCKERCNAILADLAKMGFNVLYHSHIQPNDRLTKSILTDFSRESFGEQSKSILFSRISLDNPFEENSPEATLISDAWDQGCLVTQPITHNNIDYLTYVIDYKADEKIVIVASGKEFVTVKLHTNATKNVISDYLSEIINKHEDSNLSLKNQLVVITNKLSTLGRVESTTLTI